MVLGQQFSTALTSTGRVFTWGDNRTGQLGDQTFTSRTVPTDITRQFTLTGEDTITELAMGSSHAGALSQDGRVFMWGSGDNGRLGDGVLVDRNVSAPIDITSQFTLSTGERILTLVLGGAHTGAITTEGRLFLWGWNDDGQLGDGSTIQRHTPVDISNALTLEANETFLTLSLGAQHSALLSSQGRLWVWGDGSEGRLAGVTTSIQSTPTLANSQFSLTPLETFTQLSLGLDHGAVVTSVGRFLTWGNNLRGQIGDNTNEDRDVPYALRSWMMTVLLEETRPFGQPLDLPVPSSNQGGFSGWFFDRDFLVPITDITMPAQSLTLYGKFNP